MSAEQILKICEGFDTKEYSEECKKAVRVVLKKIPQFEQCIDTQDKRPVEELRGSLLNRIKNARFRNYDHNPLVELDGKEYEWDINYDDYAEADDYYPHEDVMSLIQSVLWWKYRDEPVQYNYTPVLYNPEHEALDIETFAEQPTELAHFNRNSGSWSLMRGRRAVFKRGERKTVGYYDPQGKWHISKISRLIDQYEEFLKKEEPLPGCTFEGEFERIKKARMWQTIMPPIGKRVKARVRISTDPADVLRKSQGQTWESCETIFKGGTHGAYWRGPFDDVANWNAVAYTTLGDSPTWATRVMLRWCVTDDGREDIGIDYDPDWEHHYGNLALSKATVEKLKEVLAEEGHLDYKRCRTPYSYVGWSDWAGEGDLDSITYSPKPSADLSEIITEMLIWLTENERRRERDMSAYVCRRQGVKFSELYEEDLPSLFDAVRTEPPAGGIDFSDPEDTPHCFEQLTGCRLVLNDDPDYLNYKSWKDRVEELDRMVTMFRLDDWLIATMEGRSSGHQFSLLIPMGFLGYEGWSMLEHILAYDIKQDHEAVIAATNCLEKVEEDFEFGSEEQGQKALQCLMPFVGEIAGYDVLEMNKLTPQVIDDILQDEETARGVLYEPPDLETMELTPELRHKYMKDTICGQFQAPYARHRIGELRSGISEPQLSHPSSSRVRILYSACKLLSEDALDTDALHQLRHRLHQGD